MTIKLTVVDPMAHFSAAVRAEMKTSCERYAKQTPLPPSLVPRLFPPPVFDVRKYRGGRPGRFGQCGYIR